MKDGFGEAVVACDMPKPCKFPSLDSCQRARDHPILRPLVLKLQGGL